MKYLSIILNVVLIIAVGVLYFMHFNQNPDTAEESVEEPQSVDFTIAYINPDSVLRNYEYSNKLRDELTADAQRKEKDYQNRVQGLQREVTDYQQNVGSLTIAQAKALEENLVQKQQNLQLYQQKLSQDLLAEEAKINKDLYDRVTGFLSRYGAEKNLQLVVQYNQGSDVLFASDAMDITKIVIDGLNAEYQQELANPSDSTATE